MTRASFEAQARHQPGRGAVHRHARPGSPGHPALRADLVGRQHHQLGDAALEHPHRAADEPVGHVQRRPRRRRLRGPGPRSGALRALGAGLLPQSAHGDELLEGRRHRQRALAAPGGDAAGAPPRSRCATGCCPTCGAVRARARPLHEPIIRPTFYDFPDDEHVFRRQRRFHARRRAARRAGGARRGDDAPASTCPRGRRRGSTSTPVHASRPARCTRSPRRCPHCPCSPDRARRFRSRPASQAGIAMTTR